MAATSSMIFLIGLHKTGLTSLSSTLNLWGFPILKFPKTLSAIENYCGASDLPVARCYQELDRIYPGSKFILTEREIDAWIASAIGHHQRWSNLKNAPAYMRREFEAVYGSLEINPEVWKNAYLSHQIEVSEYFQDRPNDLLHLNIFQKEAKSKLELFLEIEVQEINIAHLNKREI